MRVKGVGARQTMPLILMPCWIAFSSREAELGFARWILLRINQSLLDLGRSDLHLERVHGELPHIEKARPARRINAPSANCHGQTKENPPGK